MTNQATTSKEALEQCCDEWPAQSAVIDSYIKLQSARSGQDTFKLAGGISFRFCPWCGKSRSGVSAPIVAPPNHALAQLLNAALLHPESAEGNIRQVIEALSAPPSVAPVVDESWAKTAAANLNRENWLLSDATQEELDKVAAVIHASAPDVNTMSRLYADASAVVDRLSLELSGLRSSARLMSPVVDAAIAYTVEFKTGMTSEALQQLAIAVNAYKENAAPASPVAPQQSEQSLKKLAARIIDAVVKSPCVVEVRFFSQPEEAVKLENQIAGMLTPITAPASPAALTKQPEHDWQWYDRNLRATGYTDLANRMLAEFKPHLRAPAALRDEAQPRTCVKCGHKEQYKNFTRNYECYVGLPPCGCKCEFLATTPPSTLAKAAAEEIVSAFPEIKEHDKWVTLGRVKIDIETETETETFERATAPNLPVKDQIAAIIERCLAGGGEK